jgi:hypothetical protein
MISANGGGSNGYRVPLWKIELQKTSSGFPSPFVICRQTPSNGTRLVLCEPKLIGAGPEARMPASNQHGGYSVPKPSCRNGWLTESDAGAATVLVDDTTPATLPKSCSSRLFKQHCVL